MIYSDISNIDFVVNPTGPWTLAPNRECCILQVNCNEFISDVCNNAIIDHRYQNVIIDIGYDTGDPLDYDDVFWLYFDKDGLPKEGQLGLLSCVLLNPIVHCSIVELAGYLKTYSQSDFLPRVNNQLSL